MTETLGAIGQIARSVKDVEAAKAWYGGVLGLPLLFAFPGLAFFDCGGTRLMLSGDDAGAGASVLYFRVADIHQAAAAIAARGAELISAPHRIHTHEDGTEEWMAFVNDNEGRPIGLMAIVKP